MTVPFGNPIPHPRQESLHEEVSGLRRYGWHTMTNVTLSTGLFCLICSVVSSEHPAGALRRGSLPFGWKVAGKFRIDVIGHSFRSLVARLAPFRVAVGEPYVTEREAIHSARSAGRRRRPTSARPNTVGNAFQDAVGCPRRVWSGHADGCTERSTVHDGAKQHGQPMPAAGRSNDREYSLKIWGVIARRNSLDS